MLISMTTLPRTESLNLGNLHRFIEFLYLEFYCVNSKNTVTKRSSINFDNVLS